jgi:hypothetical protein
MNKEDIDLLKENNWIVESESPFEIRYTDGGAFASGFAAQIVLDDLKRETKLFVIRDSHIFKIINNEKFIEEINKTLDNMYG